MSWIINYAQESDFARSKALVLVKFESKGLKFFDQETNAQFKQIRLFHRNRGAVARFKKKKSPKSSGPYSKVEDKLLKWSLVERSGYK